MTTAKKTKDDDAEKDTPQDENAAGEPVTMGGAQPPRDDTDDGVLRGFDTSHALATRAAAQGNDGKSGDGDS